MREANGSKAGLRSEGFSARITGKTDNGDQTVPTFFGHQHKIFKLIFYLLLGFTVSSYVGEPKSFAATLTPERKPMFKLLDRYKLPESADELAWNRQGNKLVVGSWPERQGNTFRWGAKFSDAEKEENIKYRAFDAFAAVLEIKDGQLHKTHQFKLNPHAKGNDVVAFSPDAHYIAVGNTTVELFDLLRNRSAWVTEQGLDRKQNVPLRFSALAFSGDGRLLSVASSIVGKDTALYWGEFSMADGAYKVNHQTASFNYRNHTDIVGDRWSVTSEMTTHEVIPRRGWVVVREMASGKEVARLEPTRPPGASLSPTALALSHDRRHLALGGSYKNKRTGYTENYLQIWDLKEQRLMHEHVQNDNGPLPSGGMINSLDFSPDGRLLLMHQAQAKKAKPDLHLFEVESGERLWSSDGQVSSHPCRFSPSGEMFACRGYREILVFKKNQ